MTTTDFTGFNDEAAGIETHSMILVNSGLPPVELDSEFFHKTKKESGSEYPPEFAELEKLCRIADKYSLIVLANATVAIDSGDLKLQYELIGSKRVCPTLSLYETITLCTELAITNETFGARDILGHTVNIEVIEELSDSRGKWFAFELLKTDKKARDKVYALVCADSNGLVYTSYDFRFDGFYPESDVYQEDEEQMCERLRSYWMKRWIPAETLK